MCLYPKLILNKKYTANKKNGGIIPPIIDERTMYVSAGCGKCIECIKQKGRSWQIRLFEEIKETKNGKFVTLSFSEKSLYTIEKELNITGSKHDLDNRIATYAVRHFLERWRYEKGKSVKHWLITELGHKNTERIHIHGIIFTDDINMIEKKWTYGNVWIGNFVNRRTINYIIKYITKTDIKHKNFTPKVLCSKGIGSNYLKNNKNSKLNKFTGNNTRDYYRTETGQKIALPNYYRKHIYNDDEREKLWINKIEKGDIYVMGEKININDDKNITEYQKLINYYRKINERLGYGSDKINFDERLYKLRLKQQKIRNLKYNK